MALPPLDQLRAFVAVATRSSFTQAAADLLVSKATVSKQVADLEAGLGTALLVRTTRALSLTEAGRAALVRARRILEEAEALAEEAAEGQAAPRGVVRIAAPLTFGQLWLAPALPRFFARYPDIRLELSLDDRATDLTAESIDLALRIGTMAGESSLLARQLAPVRLWLVASPDYWARRGRPQRPEDLALHACIRYANNLASSSWRFTGPAGQEVRVRVDGPLCVNNGAVEVPSLEAGVGCAVLPDFIVQGAVRAGTLQTALPDWHAGERVLHTLTAPGRSRTRRLEALLGFLAEEFQSRTPPWCLEGTLGSLAP
jgi:DNA-binding transcriptional LysR family regulator